MALSIATTERRAFIIKMRTAGASFDRCAEEAVKKFGADNLPRNYDGEAAWQDIQRAQKKIYRDLAEIVTPFRFIQTERYESLIRAHWPKAVMGHLGATDRVLKAMRDENRLLGLEAPQQVDMRVLQVDARIEELLEAVAARRQAQAGPSLGAGDEPDPDSIVEGTCRHL